MTISEEDATLFREMTQGVRKLKQPDRATHDTPKPTPHAQSTQMEEVPAHWYDETVQPLELEPEQQVAAEEVLFYVRDNLPHTTLQKLKKGSLCSGLEIDLHGLTTVQARDEMEALLQQAVRQQLRCFRLIHGKGHRSAEQNPVLKSWVNQWLRQQKEVLAFCSARQRDGGTGALYVLLKRN